MKVKVFVLTLTAILLLPASSAWEGAGAVAPAGELPQSGYFIATNSFPRNTVVDITNIETGRSTRAIVANTLNSPGLLAIVSREAAELIGMRAGSTSRIRVIQPADPIAYLRFTENVNTGTPSFDSGNVIDEASLMAEVYAGDTYSPPASVSQAQTPPAQNSNSNSVTGPSYVMEPEWGGPGRMNIVDVPGFNVDPVERNNVTETPERTVTPQTPAAPVQPQVVVTPPQPESQPVINNDRPSIQVVEQWRDSVYVTERERDNVTKDISERYDEVPSVSVDKEPNEFFAEINSDEVDKPATEFIAEEEPRTDVAKPETEFIAEETPRDELIKDISERQEYVAVVEPVQEPVEQVVQEPVQEPAEQIAEEPVQEPVEQVVQEPVQEPVQQAAAQPQYNLVETSQQPPPDNIYGIDPNDIIPGVAIARPEQTVNQETVQPAVQEVSPPPVQQQQPVQQPVQQQPVVTETPAVTEAPSVTEVPAVTPTPPVTLTPVPTAPQPPVVSNVPSPPAQPPADRSFAVRTISQLDRGRYYVQIAALPAESVDNAIRQIDRHYDPVVYRDGSNLYRILIGPLNQGEGAAILARFRSIGYRDAFVRMGS